MFWLFPSPASLNVTESTPASEMAEVADTKCGLVGVSRDSSASSDGRAATGRLRAAPRARNQDSNMRESPSGGWPASEVEGPSPGGHRPNPPGCSADHDGLALTVASGPGRPCSM